MAFLSSLNISGSALTAQKIRMDIISQNLSNSETTRTENGGPYKRKMVVFAESKNNNSFDSILNNKYDESECSGVEVSKILEDDSAIKPIYSPGHPDADANGYVMLPDINTSREMVDMISASRSYEANVTAFNAMKGMAAKALEIGK